MGSRKDYIDLLLSAHKTDPSSQAIDTEQADLQEETRPSSSEEEDELDGPLEPSTGEDVGTRIDP